MVIEMLDLVDLGLSRPDRGLRVVCTIWEGAASQRAQSPQAARHRRTVGALHHRRLAAVRAERVASRQQQGMYTYVDADACKMGLVNRDGAPVKKTRRWHLWGPTARMLEVAGVDGGIASSATRQHHGARQAGARAAV